MNDNYSGMHMTAEMVRDYRSNYQKIKEAMHKRENIALVRGMIVAVILIIGATVFNLALGAVLKAEQSEAAHLQLVESEAHRN
jgi:hypothetical protein